MFGATALIVSGYSDVDRKALSALMQAHSLDTIPTVFIDLDRAHLSLETLARERDISPAPSAPALRRAIVMSGLSEQELHALMNAYRESGMPRQLWASVTPVSRHWSLCALLDELSKEKEELRKAVLARRAESQPNPPSGT